MKKKYLFILIIIITSSFTYSQPILNASDFAATYHADVFDGDITGLSEGNSGANQLWDFSSVPLTYKYSITKIPIESAPFANNFSSANFCWKFVSPTYTNYQFYKLDNSTFEFMANVSDQSITYDYTPNPLTVFTFPYVFDTFMSDTYQEAGNSNIFVYPSHYDAYGTLITPYGTFNNVIRQKYLDFYSWYHVDPFYIIASGDFSENHIISFYQTTTLSLNNHINDRKITLYPNPTTSSLNIKLPDNSSIDNIIITDLTGKTVQEEIQNSNLVNVVNLVEGIYILQVFSSGSKFESKFVKF
jgi:hypothetical protein